MKVIHIGHNNLDGAGRAMNRLHNALVADGVDSRMLVYEKIGDDPRIEQVCHARKLNLLQRKFPHLAYWDKYHVQNRYWKMVHKWRPTSLFNNNEACMPTRLLLEKIRGADVLCLHSIQQTVSPEQLRTIQKELGIPIVWTLLDIEPITGGCHFHNRCEKFKTKCSQCPQLENSGEEDWSALNWERKTKAFADLDIAFVAATTQSSGFLKQSKLFSSNRQETILLSVESEYCPGDGEKARKGLGIPEDIYVLGFGSFNLSDERKGGALLLQALEKASRELLSKGNQAQGVMLVTFGELNGFSADHLPVEWKHLGLIQDNEELIGVYQALDVYACPSVDDLGPMVINEVMMCGKPVVAFDTGVAPDLVPMHPAGYLARQNDVDDYSAGIVHSFRVLNSKSNTASEKSLSICSSRHQAKSYKKFFNALLTEQRT